MARRFYNEQEPGLYEDQSGDLYYDPNTGEFVSASDASSISAPEPAPESQPVRGLSAATTAFLEDDYTGRMGPDGEPERYSTMRGGDPRLAQQRELEVQQERLQKPVTIRSWMTTNTKDVRGTKPADNITLQPGRQYQIVDFTGKNNGEVIASGSTPEEFLRMQDIAEGLASRGRMADWRLQEVSDEPSESKFGSALEPTTGKYITTLGGDLYNKSGWSTVADIAKIAVPIALQFVPGLGTALGAKLGLSGLGAKAAGIGLTSALGRAGAGVVTGEKLGEALKAGAISGLASGATAGLLGATGADKALSSAFGGAKGAIAGEATGKGISEAAKKLAEEGLIEVVASRLAPSLINSGLSAASGSLLGNIGKSIDPFQQALDQARLDNEFGLGDTVVTGSRIPQGGLDSIIAGALPSSLDVGAPTNTSLPGEELLAEASRIRPNPINSAIAAGTPSLLNLDIPTDVSLPDAEIDVEGSRIRPGSITDTIPAVTGAFVPSQPAPLAGPGEIVVTGQKNKPVEIGGNPTDLLADVASQFVVSDLTSPQGKSLEQEQAEKDDKKGLTPLEKASIGLTALSAVADAVGGGGGGGTVDPGTGYTVPSGPARQIRGTFNDNPFTYGQKGGQILFFGDGMAEGGEVDDDMVKHLVEYRKGGGHMGPGQVKGIGSGQDDKIPAWLSDGEYVWSAQDVADLGDGSTDEGVRRLDKMRQMVRKGAGRKDVKKIAKPQRGIEDMLKAVGGAV